MKLVTLGLILMAASLYLYYFDKVPFGEPWGIVIGALGAICFHKGIKGAEK